MRVVRLGYVAPPSCRLRTPDGSSSGCGEGAGDLFELVGDELHFSTSHDDATGALQRA